MERRDIVGGGLVGLAAMLGGPGGAAPHAQGDGSPIARALGEVRDLLDRRLQPPSAALLEVRRQQRSFMRASHKFPDFIDIGLGVWDSLYDWSVRNQQPLNVRRHEDGRYTMTFMFTTLILRPDQPDEYVGLGYDSR